MSIRISVILIRHGKVGNVNFKSGNTAHPEKGICRNSHEVQRSATQAGLTPTQVEEVDCPFVYPDEATAIRALLSAGPAVLAIQTSGEAAAQEAVAKAIARYRRAAEDYVIRNRFRYLMAAA